MGPANSQLARCVEVLFGLLLALEAAGAGRQRVRQSLECACSAAHGEDAKLFDLGCRRVDDPQGTESVFSCDTGGKQYSLDDTTVDSEPAADKYKLHTDRLAWDGARRVCQRDGGDLAVAHSDADARAMEDLFRNNRHIHEEEWINNQAWIGVTDRETEGVFLTVTGQTLKAAGWEVWSQYEPNDGLGGEDCATFTRTGMLNDMNCIHPLPFFCERELNA